MEWTMKQTTEITGLSADTLRYYEKEGLLSPRRHENKYRYYNEEDMEIIKNIIVMKYAHFTLGEMKSMEEIFHHKPGIACNEISKGLLNAKISELNQVITSYQKIVMLIEKLLAMIDTSDDYHRNEELINALMNQIYDDIRREGK